MLAPCPMARRSEDATAVRLALALKRLRARLREESSSELRGAVALTALHPFSACVHDGPATAAALAAAEHVSQQAIAQSVAPLRVGGPGPLRHPTRPTVARRRSASPTPVSSLRESIIASRNSWLCAGRRHDDRRPRAGRARARRSTCWSAWPTPTRDPRESRLAQRAPAPRDAGGCWARRSSP